MFCLVHRSKSRAPSSGSGSAVGADTGSSGTAAPISASQLSWVSLPDGNARATEQS